MQSFVPAFVYLLENSLSGTDFFNCMRNSYAPVSAWFLTLFYYTFVALLLLNMLVRRVPSRNPTHRAARQHRSTRASPAGGSAPLTPTTQTRRALSRQIAMMARSFDNVVEAASMNHIFLFTQMVSFIEEFSPPAPPPLSLLNFMFR
jgi:hypothetical protein